MTDKKAAVDRINELCSELIKISVEIEHSTFAMDAVGDTKQIMVVCVLPLWEPETVNTYAKVMMLAAAQVQNTGRASIIEEMQRMWEHKNAQA